MVRALQLAACAAVLVATAGQARADVIIHYRDVGSNLQFDYSGSLNVVATPYYSGTYATAAVVGGDAPIFYSLGPNYSFGVSDASVTHTPGPFATNLPAYSLPVQGTRSGTPFAFLLDGGIPGPATRLDLWGNWGAANSPINGQLVLTGQSSASIGMVNGWSVQTDWGSITFQQVPEPSTLAAFIAIGGCMAVFGAACCRHGRQPAATA